VFSKMSHIGKKPVIIPSDIQVKIEKNKIVFQKGEEKIELSLPETIKATLQNNELLFSPLKDSKRIKSQWGTIRALSQNAVDGLNHGFEKTLILEGIGYRMSLENNKLVLYLGFSHPVYYPVPKGISFEVIKNTILKIRGTRKDLVGQIAAEIRALKKPEPYKGKGFHYENEIIRRKLGKKAAAQTTS